MERSFYTRERGTAPRMSAQVQRVLVSFSLIFILESVRTVSTSVLLFRFVKPSDQLAVVGRNPHQVSMLHCAIKC